MDQGWVAQADDDDARQRLLVLTTAGRRVRKQAQQVCRRPACVENQLGRDFVANLNAQLDRAAATAAVAAETGKYENTDRATAARQTTGPSPCLPLPC
jgi:DNA-binding MarR family transcriptional regulator